MNRLLARLLTIVVLLAGLLMPGLVTPTVAFSIPRTMSRVVARPANGIERMVLDFPATHVGFSWVGDDGTGVRYRTVDDLGVASKWRRAHESHDLEYGNHHFSGVMVLDRPVALEWYAHEPRGRDVASVSVDYMNTLDGPLETFEAPATAEAEAETPTIVTRRQWGADESLKGTSGGCERRFFPPTQLFVHHTAGSNHDPDPAATMRAIYRFHVQDRGWCDIGYNFVIARDGTIFEGRWSRDFRPWETHDSEDEYNDAVAGAHVESFNSGSIGTSMMGNYTDATLPAAARASLVGLLAWEADRHNLDPEGTHIYKNPDNGTRKELPYIAGHRAAGQTECPGNTIARDLGNIRHDVALEMGAGKATSKLTLAPPEQTIFYSERAAVTGALATRAGAPLSGRAVTIYTRKPRKNWVQSSSVTTAADGTFVFEIRPVKKVMIAATYAGDPTTWDTTSRVARVFVRPKVSLEAREPASVDGNTVAHYPPGTTTIPYGGQIVPAHTRSQLVVRVQKVLPNGDRNLVAKLKPRQATDGTYEGSFKEALPGKKYRFITWFPGDKDHAFATSNSVFVQVDT